MGVALLAFVSALFASASGLKECLSVPSFPLATSLYSKDCRPSQHAGAFYPDELSPESQWDCWDAEEPIAKGTDAEAEEMAKTKGFAGACRFAAYRSTATPESVPFCSKFLDHKPVECHPGPEAYWGACVSKDAQVQCIPNDNQDAVAGFAKGDCKFFSVGGDPEKRYENVCQFETDDRPVKCDTVPSYVPGDASTCSSLSEEGEDAHTYGSACFSLANNTRWSCRADGADNSRSCSWTTLVSWKAAVKRIVSGRKYYDGLCLLPGSPGYHQAADWGSQGISVGLVLVLVVLIFVASSVGAVLYRRAGSAREKSLIADAASEMSVPAEGEIRSPYSGRYIAD